MYLLVKGKKRKNGKDMKWNTDNIIFLHQPEYFLGTFDNPKMQERHEKELERSLNALTTALADEPDPLKALLLLNRKDHIQFLLNNLEEFRRHNRLEETVMKLYGRDNGPFSSGGDRVLWEQLFDQCDKAKLRAHGKPCPAHIKRVYRGSISGFKTSLAWTPDQKIVEKFVHRWADPSMGGGKLYEVDISPEDVLIYMQKKHEEIVILSPDFIKSAEIREYRS